MEKASKVGIRDGPFAQKDYYFVAPPEMKSKYPVSLREWIGVCQWAGSVLGGAAADDAANIKCFSKYAGVNVSPDSVADLFQKLLDLEAIIVQPTVLTLVFERKSRC